MCSVAVVLNCQQCGRPGAIAVRFFKEREDHVLCPDCERRAAQGKVNDMDRAAWAIDAAIGKTYDYKQRRIPLVTKPRKRATPKKTKKPRR